MASTKTIQDTVNWLSAFIEQQPVLINGMDPALESANLILATMLGPPFSWPWNRAAVNFVANAQDTLVAGLNGFGFLEAGSLTPQAGGSPMPLQIELVMESDSTQGARPRSVAHLLDDGAGNITFRLVPAPSVAYVVNLLTQNKAPVVQSLGYTWAPVPDEKVRIAEWGMLALMSLIGNDGRFGEYNQKWITAILSEQGGLSELKKNIWLANWLRTVQQLQGTQLSTSERYKAREV